MKWCGVAGCAIGGCPVDCPHIGRLAACRATLSEFDLAQFDGRDRRRVAVVITADGRRVNVPIDGSGLVDVSLPGILRSLLLGLDSLLGLITGSRRENGGTRRNGR
jgi:hypothetical protein